MSQTIILHRSINNTKGKCCNKMLKKSLSFLCIASRYSVFKACHNSRQRICGISNAILMLGVAAVDAIEDNPVIYQSNEEGKM